MTLFRSGDFTLHSGGKSDWIIDCQTLSDDDYETLARLAIRAVGRFGAVEGVPRGGIKFAAALKRYVMVSGPLLIADDVLTTGASMEDVRRGRVAIGVVIFARGPCPDWVEPLFTANIR